MKHYTMKMWGSGDMAPPFFTSAVDAGDWSVSRPLCFTSRERAYPLDGRLVGLQS
jgi:hypothetical protein